MAKYKTTKKSIKEKYDKIIKIGYCNAQYLLQYESEIAYSTRAEGWACDYYEIGDILISTGYAPMESKNVKCTYDIVEKYEDLARNNVLSNIPYEEKLRINKDLLNQFVNEVFK
jgi:hypothetical protein